MNTLAGDRWSNEWRFYWRQFRDQTMRSPHGGMYFGPSGRTCCVTFNNYIYWNSIGIKWSKLSLFHNFFLPEIHRYVRVHTCKDWFIDVYWGDRTVHFAACLRKDLFFFGNLDHRSLFNFFLPHQIGVSWLWAGNVQIWVEAILDSSELSEIDVGRGASNCPFNFDIDIAIILINFLLNSRSHWNAIAHSFHLFQFWVINNQFCTLRMADVFDLSYSVSQGLLLNAILSFRNCDSFVNLLANSVVFHEIPEIWADQLEKLLVFFCHLRYSFEFFRIKLIHSQFVLIWAVKVVKNIRIDLRQVELRNSRTDISKTIFLQSTYFNHIQSFSFQLRAWYHLSEFLILIQQVVVFFE